MARNPSSQTYAPPSQTYAPPSDIPLRQLSAIIFIGFLILYARPFTPGVWFLGWEIGRLFDLFVSTIIYLAGLYFQWAIAGIQRPLLISIPMPSTRSGHTIQNGRLVEREGESWNWVFDPADYWRYLGIEGALVAAMWGIEVERVYQGCACIIFTGLWGIGWFCVSPSTKRMWWAQIKEAWIWMAIREVLMGSLVQGGGRRRGGRY
jgi:hypothetical protein